VWFNKFETIVKERKVDEGTALQTPLWQNLIILIPIVLLIVYSVWRRRKQGSTKLQVAIGLLQDTNHNIKVMNGYISNWRKVKKFKTGNLKKHKEHMDFLDVPIQNAINQTYTMADEFNQQIEIARKNKQPSYVSGLPVEKLKEPLTAAKQGVVTWIQANLQTELYANRRRGIFG